MNHKVKKFLPIVLSYFLITSVLGCNFENATRKESTIKSKETELTCPDLKCVDDLKKLDDNSIALIGTDKDDNFKFYISKDKGKTWVGQDMPQIDNTNRYVSMATISKNKEIAFLNYDKNMLKNSHDIINNTFSIIDKDEKISNLNVNLSNEKIDTMNIMKFASNGDLIASLDDRVVQIDSKTGEIKYQYPLDKDTLRSMCSISNYLIIATSSGQVLKYNINTGKKVGKIKKLEKYVLENYNQLQLVSGTRKNEIIITCTDGIFKYDLSENSIKQIVDGNNTSLDDRHLYHQQVMKIDDQNYFVAFQDKNNVVRLYKYSLSKELVKTSSKQLKVYSLYSDALIKDFIREYHKKHPNLYVNYELGVDSNISEDDAIKKLNTEIMAGRGPDVLFLDNLSSEYYQQKGVLADLSNIVDNRKDSLLNGVVNNYYINNKIYMLPLRGEVPVIIGEKNAICDINDLVSLYQTINNKFGQQNKSIMNINQPRDIVNLMYYTSSDKMIQDKKINKEYLKSFIDNTKKIYEIVRAKMSQVDKDAFQKKGDDFTATNNDGYDVSQNQYLEKSERAVDFINPNFIQLDIGYVKEFKDIATLQSISNFNGNLEYKSFSGDGESTYLPKEIVSINSKAQKKDLAKDFISSLLDEDYQSMEEVTGLPISKVALLKMYKENSKVDCLGKYGVGTSEENAIFCNIVPPTEEEFKKFEDIMNKLDKSVNMKTDLLIPLTKATENYVSGKYTLDQAVEYISKELEIKLSE